jgi:hypothetical protein
MSVIMPETTTDRFEPIWIGPEAVAPIIAARPLVMDDLTADVFGLFELVDDNRRDQLLDYWQQLFEKQCAAKAVTACTA